MNQTVGYSKDDLDHSFEVMRFRLANIDNEIRMMEEQGAGLIEHLDWASSARRLFLELNRVKEELASFGVMDIYYDHLVSSEYSYEGHLGQVLENFKREWIKQQAHPDDGLY